MERTFRGNATVLNYIESAEAAVLGGVGVVLNLLIIIITIHPKAIDDKQVDSRFKWFIGNLALADLNYSAYLAFIGQFMAVNFFHIEFNNYVCTLFQYWSTSGFACAITCLPLLAINRYVSLCRSPELYERLFTKRRIAILCLLGYIPLIVMAPTFFAAAKFNRKCGVWYKCGICQRINSSLPLIGVFIFVFCTYKVYRKLHAHQDFVRSMQDTERYRANQTLLHCLIAQGIVPVVCAVPALGLIIVHAFMPTSPTINVSVSLLLRLNPVCDALGTLVIVKPYKRAALAFLRGLKNGAIKIVPEETIAAGGPPQMVAAATSSNMKSTAGPNAISKY